MFWCRQSHDNFFCLKFKNKIIFWNLLRSIILLLFFFFVFVPNNYFCSHQNIFEHLSKIAFYPLFEAFFLLLFFQTAIWIRLHRLVSNKCLDAKSKRINFRQSSYVMQVLNNDLTAWIKLVMSAISNNNQELSLTKSCFKFLCCKSGWNVYVWLVRIMMIQLYQNKFFVHSKFYENPISSVGSTWIGTNGQEIDIVWNIK